MVEETVIGQPGAIAMSAHRFYHKTRESYALSIWKLRRFQHSRQKKFAHTPAGGFRRRSAGKRSKPEVGSDDSMIDGNGWWFSDVGTWFSVAGGGG
jgi:hypothetical protein